MGNLEKTGFLIEETDNTMDLRKQIIPDCRLEYRIENETVRITGNRLSNDDLEIIIPGRIGSMPVTEIGKDAFTLCARHFSIRSSPDSYATRYARRNNIRRRVPRPKDMESGHTTDLLQFVIRGVPGSKSGRRVMGYLSRYEFNKYNKHQRDQLSSLPLVPDL